MSVEDCIVRVYKVSEGMNDRELDKVHNTRARENVEYERLRECTVRECDNIYIYVMRV